MDLRNDLIDDKCSAAVEMVILRRSAGSVKRVVARVHETGLHRRFSRVYCTLRKRLDGVMDKEESLLKTIIAVSKTQEAEIHLPRRVQFQTNMKGVELE